MKRSVIGTLLLAFALLLGVSALCRATKPKPSGVVVRGCHSCPARELGPASDFRRVKAMTRFCSGKILVSYLQPE